MGEKKRRERFADQAESNPVLAATIFGIGGAILGLTYAAMNSTPEKRRALKEEMARRRKEQAGYREQSQRSSLRFRLQQSYFREGRGNDLYRQRAFYTLPVEGPFADGTIEWRYGSYGGSSFVAASLLAGATLTASYEPRDAQGACQLVRPDGSQKNASATFHGEIFSTYASSDVTEANYDACLMARLLAAPGSPFRRIELQRPDRAEIREAIWQEYLKDNPHVAAAIGDG